MTRHLGPVGGQRPTHHESHHLFSGQKLAPAVSLHGRQSRAAVLRCTATAVAAPPPTSSYKKAKIHQDYAAVDSDSAVLKRPLKDVLTAEEVKDVFGYPRDLRDWYSIGKILGAGSFGVVREAVHLATHRRYACKTIPKIPKRGQGTPRYLLKLQTEVDAMQQLGPSFDAVSLKGVFEDDDNIHIVMELCLGGALMDRVKQGTVTEKKIARIIRSILRFIAQCHAKGVIYRDVKPDNFLFLSKDDNSPLRATDFGLSIRHKAEDGKLKSRSGTPVYMAPEVIMQEYGPVADEWSVGMLMYQLLTGVFPFWDSVQNVSLQQVWQAILVKKVDLDSKQAQAMMSEGARHLLKGLLTRNPRDRLTAAKALDHPWVREGGEASEEPLGNTLVQRLQRHATYGHFKQLVLQIIADDVIDNGHDPDKVFATLRNIFNTLDVDKSGGVSMEELSEGLVNMGYLVSKDEMETLMSRIDLNDNGNIEFEEFAAGMLDWRQMQQDNLWSRWVDIAFAKLDSNGDGFIDLDELIVRLPILTGTDNPEAERVLAARRMLREGDTNGDGLVCKEEFTHLLQAGSVEDSLDAYDARWSKNRVVLGPGEHSTTI